MPGYALTAYGLPHAMGLLPARDGSRPESPLTLDGLIDAAAGFGLAGVDAPIPADVDPVRLRARLEEAGLRLVVECGCVVDGAVEDAAAQLRRAQAAGASVVRFTLSAVLCGDRRTLAEGWPARLDAVVERLKVLLPVAEGLGIALALENHQDATCEDLESLHERSGSRPSFGITLDAGNPLAVGQDPVETAVRLAPLIRHVHLKDYTIHFAPQGYRLVRCAAGTGVVDFPAILAAVRGNGFDPLLPGIEIAAQATRTIPWLDPGWWESYPPRDARELLPALRILWARGVAADVPYSSAWERGAGSAEIVDEEWRLVRESVAYFQGLEA